MTQPVRFAVVGVTGYSRSHLAGVKTLAERGLGQLVASMMIDKSDHPDLVAEFEANGIRVFDHYETMLDECVGQVDVVTLPVPIYLHAPMTAAALERGYHVLVEKPVAGSLDEVARMIAARDAAAGCQCAVGFQAIYSTAIQAVKRYVVEGRLGRVRSIRIGALWPRDPSYYGRNGWAGKLYVDGRPVFDSPFNNALAHQLMNLLYLASPRPGQAAHVVELEAELYRAYPIESFDTGCLRAITDEGSELYFAASHACDQNLNPSMYLEAEKASVEWHYQGSATVTFANGEVEQIEQPSDPRDEMFEQVVDALTGAAGGPHCTLEIGRAHVALIEALHRQTPIV
ncbi:MAG: Gfo/Idh/MocA family oxidoreductase, partial [Anaerolineae bacterium]|nr:Gfo/Idh/MocA family oxidoreductase [Anaerolineae bacterium]